MLAGKMKLDGRLVMRNAFGAAQIEARGTFSLLGTPKVYVTDRACAIRERGLGLRFLEGAYWGSNGEISILVPSCNGENLLAAGRLNEKRPFHYLSIKTSCSNPAHAPRR